MARLPLPIPGLRQPDPQYDYQTVASWGTQSASLHAPTNTPGNQTLYQWGPAIQFQVWPLNVHELDHETQTQWAQKAIAGAATYREWTGENDELRHFRGKIFPYRIGGMTELDLFEAYRRAGAAQMLVRGDGRVMGWYVCEKLVRSHTFFSSEGVGRQIAFEAVMARVPMPAADSVYTEMWQVGQLASAY